MLRLFAKNGKSKTDYALLIVDIGMNKVFRAQYKTLEQCSESLGISRQSYSETWQRYTDEVVELLRRHLFDANLVAGDYFYKEKFENNSKISV